MTRFDAEKGGVPLQASTIEFIVHVSSVIIASCNGTV